VTCPDRDACINGTCDGCTARPRTRTVIGVDPSIATIEQAAIRAFQAGSPGLTWERRSDATQEHYRRIARAVLGARR
jgi:hypothetical protein